MLAAISSTTLVFWPHNSIGWFLPRNDDSAIVRGILISGFSLVVPVSLLAGMFLAALMQLTVVAVCENQDTLSNMYIENPSLPIVRLAGLGVAIAFGLGSTKVAWAYVMSYAVAAGSGFFYLCGHTDLLSFGSVFQTCYGGLLPFSLPLLMMSAVTIAFKYIDIYSSVSSVRPVT